MDMKGDVRLLPKTDCSVKHLKKGGSCVYDGMKKVKCLLRKTEILEENKRKSKCSKSNLIFLKKVIDMPRRGRYNKKADQNTFNINGGKIMSTFMAKNENIQRKWYVLDAAGKPLGRTAALAASILKGKHKVDYTPHADCGDYVIIINADKGVLTGKKLTQKYYRTHSGYAGGLKETQYSRLMAHKPQLAMKIAVRGMLPKNSVGRWSLGRLKIYAGEQHKQQAQKPELWAGK